MTTVLLLHILQKYSEKVEIFEGLLAGSVSWCTDSWQWWRFHLVCLCVVITDCKKLKNSLFIFTTSFVETDELVKKLEWLVGGAHSMLSQKPTFSW